MSKRNDPRHRLKRMIKEQWLKKLAEMQEQTMLFIPDYAEGTDSNIIISSRLQALNSMIEILKVDIKELQRLV